MDMDSCSPVLFMLPVWMRPCHFFQGLVEWDKEASKPVAQHFNLPNHSSQHMTICSLSLHQENTESHQNLGQKFIFQIGTLNPYGINERFSFN